MILRYKLEDVLYWMQINGTLIPEHGEICLVILYGLESDVRNVGTALAEMCSGIVEQGFPKVTEEC